MFQCYLDDSGTSGLPIVTMAGFIAAQSVWEELEIKFNEVLNLNNIPVLHAKEFHDTKPPFAGWSKRKKRNFAEELFSISHGRIYGLSATIRKEDYLKSQRETGNQGMSVIGACFSAIMTRIITDPQISIHVKAKGVSFLIENGNKNNGGIEKFFYDMAKQEFFGGCLRSISFISKSSCRAIQIADFFAFYSRREMRNHDRFAGKQFVLPACPYLQIMQKHGPIWQRAGIGPTKTLAKITDLKEISALQALMRVKSS